jgi:hypothetical protein
MTSYWRFFITRLELGKKKLVVYGPLLVPPGCIYLKLSEQFQPRPKPITQQSGISIFYSSYTTCSNELSVHIMICAHILAHVDSINGFCSADKHLLCADSKLIYHAYTAVPGMSLQALFGFTVHGQC